MWNQNSSAALTGIWATLYAEVSKNQVWGTLPTDLQDKLYAM